MLIARQTGRYLQNRGEGLKLWKWPRRGPQEEVTAALGPGFSLLPQEPRMHRNWGLSAYGGRLTLTGRTLRHDPRALWRRLGVRSAPDLP